MNKTVILLLSLALVIFNCCEKDELKSGSFSGIVTTNEFGDLLGTKGQEDGDWGFNDNFSPPVLEFFSQSFICPEQEESSNEEQQELTTEESDIDTNTVPAYQVSESASCVYPNLAMNIVTLKSHLPEVSDGYFKCVFVDKDNNILFKKCMFAQSFIHMNLSLSSLEGIQKGELHRLYYLTERTTGEYANMGHGDILMQ